MKRKAVFTTFETAKLCHVSPLSIINWVNAGRLPAFRTPGGHRRIRREDLVRFMKENGIPLAEELREGSGKSRVLIVVEEPSTIYAVERTAWYRGLYHVLLGALSPLDGIGPADIRAQDLIDRVKGGGVQEVIVATNPTIEGEATAIYLAKMLKPFGLRVSRIAYGLPVGMDIDYADEVTLTKSIEGRREL